jgi:hypothetical protein
MRYITERFSVLRCVVLVLLQAEKSDGNRVGTADCGKLRGMKAKATYN